MSDVYEWLGFVIYWGYIALMMIMLGQGFVQALSFMLVCIVAAFRHDRASKVSWKRVPVEFLHRWRDFTSNGTPDSLSSKYVRWEGAFKWTIYPKDIAP